ncbi:MAG: TusE/DsrC/DsvC family sulfur relay protein [Gammaproteobacteria bacterium]|nr:TusE/DsrC/DsvC family sulfur relay protein [Gammaproteobacteria bacterium]MDH5734578.1 TusE/DsrC/DsvC family sulfur relay protein [Gammaproteobacteria bacterium]
MAFRHDLLEVAGVQYHLTDEGRLQNVDDWTDAIAEAIAEHEGLVLTDEHWQIISMLRNFYKEYNHAPIMKLFLKEVANKLGRDYANEDYLSQLFPDGILAQSTKIAGLPCPHRAALINNYRPVVVKEQSEVNASANKEKSFEFEFNGEIYHLSKEGNLIERYAWTESMGELLAARDNLQLTEDHWIVIRFMRNFYNEYLITPMVKLLLRHMRESLGAEKSNKEYLYQLFPDGPSKQGSRIAGLPYPVGCID